MTQNINVDGQQVDIVCEKWVSGIGKTRLCIDCKYTRLDENRSVSKDDVDQFIFTFRNRADANGWTAGVIVSNRPFSQHAKTAAARHLNIHLKTVDELHEEILNIRSYLYESVHGYEENNRFFDFIPPNASNSQSPQGTGDLSLLQTIVENWLQDSSAHQLCLFGDFGTGKTTFLEHLHYTFAKRYLADASCRIPLLIPLRRYYEAADHEEIIKNFFSLECSTTVQLSVFQEFLVKGRLLLLLDGFDEMGARSDPTTRKANYLKLAPLAEEASKIIISCRPAYFLSLEETHSVFSFVNRQIGFAPPIRPSVVSEQLFRAVQHADLKPMFAQTKSALGSTSYVHMALFDKKQIRAYLKKHNKTIETMSGRQLDARKLFERIRDIYDLEDLAQRPILLKLIVSTLPLFRKSTDGSYEVELEGSTQKVPDITPSVLYAVYTEKELEREYKKGKVRWLIDRQDKVRTIAAIAYEMFKKDALALDRTSLAQVVERVFPASEADQASYLTDIRTCSFLSRDNQDSVRFTHKSFMEYYAAVSLRLSMTGPESVQNLFSIRRLSDEVAFFLGDAIAVSSSAVETLSTLAEVYSRLSRVPSPSETCMENLLNVLNYGRKPVSPLKGPKIGTLVYRKLAIKEQAWDSVSIKVL